MLRQTFLDPRPRTADANWVGVARFVVGLFRGEAGRAGAGATAQPLVGQGEAESGERREGTRRPGGEGLVEQVRVGYRPARQPHNPGCKFVDVDLPGMAGLLDRIEPGRRRKWAVPSL